MRTGKMEWILDWKRAGAGVGVAGTGILVVTMLGAWLMEMEILAVEAGNYLAAASLLLSSFLGGLVGGAGGLQWKQSAAVVIGMLGLLVMGHVLVTDGGAWAGVYQTMLPVVGGCGAATLMNGGGKGRKRRRHRGKNW